METAYDVLVIGAGVAGVAAALQAARSGYHTALVEKTVFTGGLATTGLVNVYLPLCDGRGRQVTYGIAEELLHLSLKYGPGQVPDGWPGSAAGERKERYLVRFAPASLVLALDEALEEAGVALWLDTLACQPLMAGNRVVGVEVENKSGRQALRGGCLIDATGDADICYRTGAECAETDNWLSLWGHQVSAQALQEALGQSDPEALLHATTLRLGSDDRGRGAPPDNCRFDGTDGEQVTRFILEGRRLLRAYYQEQYAAGSSSRHSLFPLTLPAMAQFRTTRRIVGQQTLTDGQHGTRFPDSIGLVADWRKPGYVWEIPYGVLIPRGITGLLAAGRCIASAGDAWQVTRVIPPAGLTGQVAGLAAGLAVQRATTPDRLEVKDIQAQLHMQGIRFHHES